MSAMASSSRCAQVMRSSCHVYRVPISPLRPTTRPNMPPIRHQGTFTRWAIRPNARLRINPIIYLIMAGVLFYPVYKAVEAFSMFNAFPPSVRKPLRKALRARNRDPNDPEAEEAFLEAIDTALAFPPEAFGANVLLKISGLYATFAAHLESQNDLVRSYEMLQGALVLFGADPLAADPSVRLSSKWTGQKPLDEAEHVRAIALNQKMGQLALSIALGSKVRSFPATSNDSGPKTYLDAAESHLSSALTAMLRLGGLSAKGKEPMTEPIIVGRDVNLPETSSQEGDLGGMVDMQGLGVTMEALAEVHAKKGEFDIAGQLLLQAISTLMPPQNQALPPAVNRCQAAMLMSNLAGYASQPGTPDARKVSRSWALRSIQLAKEAAKDAEGSKDGSVATPLCGRAMTVGLYNMGMLAEAEKDIPKALEMFSKSLAKAKDVHFTVGEVQSAEAIRRAQRSIK